MILSSFDGSAFFASSISSLKSNLNLAYAAVDYLEKYGKE